MKLRILFVAMLGIGVLAACGDGYGSSSTPADSTVSTDRQAVNDPGSAAAITVSNFSFQVPDSVTAGESVTIANDDSVAHTFSAVDGSFSVDLPAGGSATLTAPAAGSYDVVCHIHSSMKATLVVA
jgi:plastocyanin